MSVKESLIHLGMNQLNEHYKYRNAFVKTPTMKQLLEIAFDIWYYLVNIHLNNKNDLAWFIHENLTDEDVQTLYWIFKQCKCCNQHKDQKSIHSLELIHLKEIPYNEQCNCSCNKARCYLYKSYHYNKYHIWI